MQELPNALSALERYPQFIVYEVRPHPTKPGKTLKIPVDRRGYAASAFDTANWSTAAVAITDAARLGFTYGAGYALTDAAGFWFIDIDDALQADGTWSDVAIQLCQIFAGCAIEVSQSGKGLHILGRGAVPEHGCKNIPMGLELYHTERFIALTGINAVGDASFVPAPNLLQWVRDSYFPFQPGAANGTNDQWADGPCEQWRGPVDDADLIRRACNSQSARAAFGNAASFRDLWEGNVDALARAYPDPDPTSSRAYDGSSADAALFSHLAFWTGRDCERMHRLAMQSALVREKWDREDYVQRTIINACANSRDVLTDKQVESPVDIEMPPSDSGYEPAEMHVRGGASFLNPEQQANLFRGCVYIEQENRVMRTGGQMLKPEQFRVRFGGYTFTLDQANEKVTRDAWEAFTQSQILRPPIVDRTAFRPQMPPGALIHEPGRTVVNNYWPITVPRKVGDITPFTNHVRLLIPDDRDREIALSYMASLVQNKGKKFQWAILIQGVQGNGKTMLARCVSEAVGNTFTFWPDAAGLESDFNGWLENIIFVGVEEIKVAEHQAKMIEKLKVMITGGQMQVQRKGIDQASKDICANFIFTTNYKNALPLDENDRRFCVFYTPHQHVSDMVRDRIDKSTDYFPNLYDWLRADGYAIVSEFLHTYPINPEFDPAGRCQRAPDTTSTKMAITESASRIEQEILEAIALDLPGFRGGYISSKMLDILLKDLRATMTYSRRKELLHKMGYIPHPGLPDGRVVAPVTPDGAKTRLYVHSDGPLIEMTGPAAIANAYREAQQMGAPVPH